MANKKIIFWDVDTQFDFMHPQGKLYVPDADKIIDNISQIRKFALENGYSIIASADWHKANDEEISQTPDYKHTFPQHCLALKPGCERVGFLGQLPIEYVQPEPMDISYLRKLVNKEQFHIVIRKNKFDVFSNPNTIKLLELVAAGTIIVFGVALDVCVYYTVSGLLRWSSRPGRPLSIVHHPSYERRAQAVDIIVLSDGVKGLGIKPDEQILKEFQTHGVKIMRLDDLNLFLGPPFCEREQNDSP